MDDDQQQQPRNLLFRDGQHHISSRSYSSTTSVTVGSAEQIKFDKGTTLDLTGGLHLTGHTATANFQRTGFDDMLDGQSGSNCLYGHSGNDIFTGGSADRFYGDAGAGNFVLYDAADIVTMGFQTDGRGRYRHFPRPAGL